MSSVADAAGRCCCWNSSSIRFTRHRPRSSAVTAGMNAVPATALGDALSWNRSNHPNSADGEGSARQHILLNRLQNCRKTPVVLKLFDVIDAIAARQVQKNNRKHHLDIEPALAAGRPNMSPDRRADTAGLDQLDIHRKTRQRRQSMARRITLILEIEKPLCHHRTPRW